MTCRHSCSHDGVSLAMNAARRSHHKEASLASFIASDTQCHSLHVTLNDIRCIYCKCHSLRVAFIASESLHSLQVTCNECHDVLQCVAVCCSPLDIYEVWCVAVCCSLLQSVAVCCSPLDIYEVCCVAVCCRVVAFIASHLQ